MLNLHLMKPTHRPKINDMKKLEKGDVVYHEEFNELIIISDDDSGYYTRGQYSNIGYCLYITHNLHLISKGDFK